MWWVLNLAHTEDQASNDFSILFKGKTFEEKLDYYDSLEESGNLFWNEVFKKLAYFISFWYMGKISSSEDFERAEKFYIPTQNDIDQKENAVEPKVSDSN